MAPPVLALRGVLETLQDAETTGNGNAIIVPSVARNHTIFIQGSAGVSAGAIQIEGAETVDYTGDWAPIGGGPVDVPDDAETIINFEGIFKAIRTRVSTDVVDGTATVKYLGN
jgi:flagellar basal body rod protein FlgF